MVLDSIAITVWKIYCCVLVYYRVKCINLPNSNEKLEVDLTLYQIECDMTKTTKWLFTEVIPHELELQHVLQESGKHVLDSSGGSVW